MLLLPLFSRSYRIGNNLARGKPFQFSFCQPYECLGGLQSIWLGHVEMGGIMAREVFPDTSLRMRQWRFVMPARIDIIGKLVAVTGPIETDIVFGFSEITSCRSQQELASPFDEALDVPDWMAFSIACLPMAASLELMSVSDMASFTKMPHASASSMRSEIGGRVLCPRMPSAPASQPRIAAASCS